MEFTYTQIQLRGGAVPVLSRPSQQTTFLTLVVTRNDHNSLVTCTTNTSSTQAIYTLNITCEFMKQACNNKQAGVKYSVTVLHAYHALMKTKSILVEMQATYTIFWNTAVFKQIL